MSTERHPMSNLVEEAVAHVVERGTENATDRDIMLAGFAWLADKLNGQKAVANESSFFVRLRGPVATAGTATGIGALMYLALQFATG